jgi:hypothetical protein
MDLPWPTRRVPEGVVDEWLDALADQAAVDMLGGGGFAVGGGG